jgi:hypothetical protein
MNVAKDMIEWLDPMLHMLEQVKITHVMAPYCHVPATYASACAINNAVHTIDIEHVFHWMKHKKNDILSALDWSRYEIDVHRAANQHRVSDHDRPITIRYIL